MCPANGKACKICKKLNHFAFVCKNMNKYNNVDVIENSSYENVEEHDEIFQF
jgi:hypothetical protein